MRTRKPHRSAALVVTAILVSSCSAGQPRLEAAAPVSAVAPRRGSCSSRTPATRTRWRWSGPTASGRTAPLHDLGDGTPDQPGLVAGRPAQFVFAMNDGERDDLWVADADGSNARMLLDCRGRCRWLDDPDWSPDGKQIVYSRTIQRAERLGDRHAGDGRRRDRPGTRRARPVEAQLHGRRAVLARWPTGGLREGSQDAAAARTPTSTRSPWSSCASTSPVHPVRAITDPRLFAATADWSPDGKRIVYSALAEPDDEAPDLFWIRPCGRPTDSAHRSVVETGATPRTRPGCRTAPGCCSAASLEGVGSPKLLTVGVDGSGLGSAFGDDVLFGTHPRVQPVP